MDKTERLTAESIRALMDKPGPCITIVLGGNEAGDTATELKVGLNGIRKSIEAHEKSARTRGDSILNAIENAMRDVRGETKARGAIAILASPADTRVFRVANTVRPVARIAEHFDLRTLLAIENGQNSFCILALSQNRIRMLRCTESTSEEIEIPGAPKSLADAMQTRPPDHVLDNRITAGPSVGAGTGVMFGTSSDRDDKDEYLLHFFVDLDRAVSRMLNGASEPLIAAGVEHEIALYRRVNTYAHLIEPGIYGAPDGLEGGEMHRRALELLAERESRRGTEVPPDFDKRVGTGHASTHVQEIVAAAFEGRISHLFFQRNASYMGSFDPVRQRVKHTVDPPDSPVDLIDAAAEQIVLHAGVVKILPASAMPNGVPVCALMRYPALQQTGAGTAQGAA
jgi:hypothetical protein